MISEEIMNQLKIITDEEKKILNGDKNIDSNLYMNNDKSIVNNKKLLPNGDIIAIRRHTRFIDFPKHTHDFVEVVYMCSGSTVHIVNGNKITLNAGELLFMSQNACQQIYKSGENDIAVNFIILPQFFDTSLKMLVDEISPLKEFIIECMSGNKLSSGYLHFKVSDVLPIQNLIENLLYSLISPTKSKTQINKTTMALLILMLCDYADKATYLTGKDGVIFEIMQYIEENYADGSLQNIANKLHFDFCALSREIKKATGKSYTQLVQNKRLSQALFLLKNTKMTISDISVSVGYENISYFHKLFYKRFNTSPKKYRDCK